jgi:hypothetical protein
MPLPCHCNDIYCLGLGLGLGSGAARFVLLMIPMFARLELHYRL